MMMMREMLLSWDAEQMLVACLLLDMNAEAIEEVVNYGDGVIEVIKGGSIMTFSTNRWTHVLSFPPLNLHVLSYTSYTMQK